jgi:hypothetical protein
MSDTLANKIQNVRIISRADYSIRSADLLEKFGLPTLDERKKRFKMSMLFKILNNNAATYLKEFLLILSVLVFPRVMWRRIRDFRIQYLEQWIDDVL